MTIANFFTEPIAYFTRYQKKIAIFFSIFVKSDAVTWTCLVQKLFLIIHCYMRLNTDLALVLASNFLITQEKNLSNFTLSVYNQINSLYIFNSLCIFFQLFCIFFFSFVIFLPVIPKFLIYHMSFLWVIYIYSLKILVFSL